jgi:hypothetical protein
MPTGVYGVLKNSSGWESILPSEKVTQAGTGKFFLKNKKTKIPAQRKRGRRKA